MTNHKEIILNLFTKKEQKSVWIPPVIDIDAVPVATWIHPSGHLGFVIHNDGENLHGIMFDRLASVSTATAGRASMCQWCKSVRNTGNVRLFTRRTSDNKSAGILLCSDLDCIASIKNPGADAFSESLTRTEKIERYYKNVKEYINL